MKTFDPNNNFVVNILENDDGTATVIGALTQDGEVWYSDPVTYDSVELAQKAIDDKIKQERAILKQSRH